MRQQKYLSISRIGSIQLEMLIGMRFSTVEPTTLKGYIGEQIVYGTEHFTVNAVPVAGPIYRRRTIPTRKFFAWCAGCGETSKSFSMARPPSLLYWAEYHVCHIRQDWPAPPEEK